MYEVQKVFFSHRPIFISYSSASTTKITQQNILFVSPKLTRMCSIFTNIWKKRRVSEHDWYCSWFITWGQKQAASETCFFQIFVTTEKKKLFLILMILVPTLYFTLYWTLGSQDDWSGPSPWTCYEVAEVASLDEALSCHWRIHCTLLSAH